MLRRGKILVQWERKKSTHKVIAYIIPAYSVEKRQISRYAPAPKPKDPTPRRFKKPTASRRGILAAQSEPAKEIYPSHGAPRGDRVAKIGRTSIATEHLFICNREFSEILSVDETRDATQNTDNCKPPLMRSAEPGTRALYP